MTDTALTVTATRPTFWSQGTCHNLPPDWFHPDRGASTVEAKAVCSTCPVRVPCLRWALDNHEKFGIWGGTSERERRRIRTRIAAARPVPELDPDWVPSIRHGTSTWPPPSLTLTSPDSPTPEPPEEPAMDLALAPVPARAGANGSRHTDTDDDADTDSQYVCAQCEVRFTPVRKDQRFHNKACARKWYAANPTGERVRKPRAARAPEQPKPSTAPAPAPTARPAPAPTGPGPVDLPVLLGQLLAACDRWAIEADLGDIRVSVTRGCVR